MRRLFLVYAVVSLVPVAVLGAVLLAVLHRTGNERGLAAARGEADLIARTSIAPLLPVSDLRAGVSATDEHALQRTVRLAIKGGDLLRLRVRDLSGRVVFSDDGSGLHGPIEDEVLDAAHGEVVATVTHLNSDSNDVGPVGPRVVEIYQPLRAASSGRRIGVLELYVPYAPIAAQVSADQRTVTYTLGGGLALLWLVLLAVSVSVTQRLRRQLVRTNYLLEHDTLTGLPNRVTFSRNVEAALAAGDAVAVALFDLDGFKHINDVLGHDTGDELLVALASRMVDAMSAGEQLARLGGDEFGVLFRGERDAEALLARLAELRHEITAPVELAGVPMVVAASAGLAVAPADGVSATALLRRADAAMYVAKRNQLGAIRYRPTHDTHDAAALALVAELERAIAEDELVLHFQPKGDLVDGTVRELEALVRWQHPTRGLLHPDAFIPLAEQTELVDRLTRWVVRAALQALVAADPTGRMAVAVNVSARSLTRADLAEELLALLDEFGLAPERLVVEITETALMSDPAAAARTLLRLHGAGTRVSIDDFGAGQTSLGYLATLPVSELKIDKTFVLPMLHDTRKDAIVRSVIELGHSLGCRVTAEGVETADVLNRLRELACDTVQGYHLSRPVPLADLATAMSAAASAVTPHIRLAKAT